MLSVIEASFNAANAAINFAPVEKARNPLDMLTDTSLGYAGGGGTDFGTDQHASQYGHFKNRFYSAARVIIHRLAQQPVHVAKRRQRRSNRTGWPSIQVPKWLGDPSLFDVIGAHPLVSVLSDPNRLMTPFNLWEMVVGSLLVTGRAFLVVMRSERDDRAFDLFAIPATWMTPVHTKRLYDHWQVKPPGSAGRPIELKDESVVHCYLADPSNPASAISPMSMQGQAILCGDAISTAQLSGFKNPMPRLAVIVGDVMNESSFTDDPNRTSSARPVKLEPAQRRQIISWIQQHYGGPAKYGVPLVLDALVRDVKLIDRKNSEMGFTESSTSVKADIDQGLSISSILMGDLRGSNRANGALAEQIAVDNMFNPLTTLISQAMNKKLPAIFSSEGERLVCWMEPCRPRDTEMDLEWGRLLGRTYSGLRNDMRRLSPFDLPYHEGFDDVVIPQTMEEREAAEDRIGVGRIPKPEPAAPADDKPSQDDESVDSAE